VNKKKLSLRFIIIFTLIIFILIASCKQKDVSDQSSQETEAVGTRFSISNPPLKEDDPGTKLVYTLNPNAAFKATYELENLRNNRNYLLLCFLDYNQEPLIIDNKKNSLFKINVKPGQKKYWRFKTNTIKNGFHDFATLLIWDPEIHRLDKDYRIESDFNLIATNRANIIADGSNPPAFSFITAPSKQSQSKEPYDGIRINKQANNLDYWLIEKALSGKKINYYIHVASSEKQPVTYALIALLDYKQIPLNKSKVLFAKVNPNQVVTFPASFTAPMQKGTHELMLIRIKNPYKRLTSDDDTLIEPSIRVPIVVK